MNKTQTCGVISLGLMGVAAVLAAIAMFLTSGLLGVVYVAICLLGPQAVLYGFCAKCPNKATCGHVFPGKAALKIGRTAGPYNLLELGGFVVVSLLLFGFPQIWLWRYPVLFVVFWGILIVAGMIIRFAMCPACGNMYCPLNSQFRKPAA